MKKGVILSGMRPTGALHLGNYFGALENWVKLQDEYECHFMVADWHALTTGYDDTEDLRKNINEMVADWLSAGLDPEKCIMFRQSDVKQHAELHLLLSMMTPLSWLERCPTYKAQLEALSDKEITTYGFLGYPCLMAADVILYKAEFVPVGEDQLPHLELAREMVRRLHSLYDTQIFPEPQPLLTQAKILPGTDGRKMSKSYNNTISLGEEPEAVRKKVMSMKTDPARIHKDDPGHPDICTVFAYQKLFNTPEKVDEIEAACKAGEIGCVQCKRALHEKVAAWHTPIYEKRSDLLNHQRPYLRELLADGSAKARAIAGATLQEVLRAMQIDY